MDFNDCLFMTKDELRVQRSIASILAKCEASMRKLEPFHSKREKEFEEFCDRIGILYSPNSF